MTLSTMSTTLSEMLGSLQTEIADMILDEVDALINDFAVRSFRDVADAEYIAARMACRAALVPQFLWASQQTVEKYLKCILLLNRIPARKVFHDLDRALRKIKESGR